MATVHVTAQNFEEVLATDKTVLLDFFATWCGPCIASIPHMEELWKQVQPHKIRIVGLNVGDRKTPETTTIDSENPSKSISELT